MSTARKNDMPLAKDLSFVTVGRETALIVRLTDGRMIGAPLSQYPTLKRATPAQRARWRLIGRGDGFQWPALDYDLSVRGILLGRAEVGAEAQTRARRAG
jgi:hypothetical protein